MLSISSFPGGRGWSGLFDGVGFFSERWMSSLLGIFLVGDEDKDVSLANAVELDGFVIS